MKVHPYPPAEALTQIQVLWQDSPFNKSEVEGPVTPELKHKEATWVIASQTEDHRKILTTLLLSAYGTDDSLDVQLADEYIFVRDVSSPPEEYIAAAKILSGMDLAKEIRWDRSVLELVKLNYVPPQRMHKPPRRLPADEIESKWFPGGARQLAELINADSTIVHSAESIYGGAQAAVRIILAAAAAGDISPDETRQLLCKMAEPLNLDSSLESALKEFLYQLSFWLNRIEATLSKLAVDRTNQLRNFLRGHRILIVEDRWTEEFWNIVLPKVLDGQVVDEFDDTFSDAKAQILVVANGREALAALDQSPHTPDIVLLDLYSSKVPQSHHSLSQIRISSSVQQLVDQLRMTRRAGGGVPEPDAAIICMSADLGGFSVRTMLRQFGSDDYIFKRVRWDAQEPSFYSSFRNAIVNGLVARIVRLLALPDENSAGHAAVPFRLWLRQFSPMHRPQALSMMRNFRYYSASAIVKVYDAALSATSSIDEQQIQILESSKKDPSSFIFSYLGRPNKSGVASLHLFAKTEFVRKIRQHTTGQMPQIVSYEDMIELVERKLSHHSNDDSSLTIVLIDDVIGSGGQTAAYLGRYLVDRIKSISQPVKGTNNSFIIRSTEGSPTTVDVRLLFAVGWKNEEIETRLKDAVDLDTPVRRGFVEADCSDLRSEWRFPVYIADWLDETGRLRDSKTEADFLTDQRYRGIVDCREDEKPADFEPFGWKSSGGLLATYANVPGNVPPVIWGSRKSWQPLFPRFFNQFTSKRRHTDEPGMSIAVDQACCETNSDRDD